MKIIVDGFGGDNAPLAVLQGCAMARREYGVEIAVTGDRDKMEQCARDNGIDLSGLELVQAATVIPVEEEPRSILTEYADSSMAVGLRMLADGKGDAFVSAGSTGALVMGASLIVKRIKGIKRAALAPIMPSKTGCYILLDVGANVDCRPEMLLQFGIMGSAYMERIMGVSAPRVGLVNIGAEETKGGELQLSAYPMFSAADMIHFTGNIEPRDIPLGGADVVVCDGFTGNVILKLTEGMGKWLNGSLKDIFLSGGKGKLAALLVMKPLKAFKKSMDYTEYGGAPLMGTAKPVIKAHGSSNGKAFMNAIRQARDYAEKDVIGQIREALSEIRQGPSGAAGDTADN